MRGTVLTTWMLSLTLAAAALAADVGQVDVDNLRRWQTGSPDDLLVIDVRAPHRFDTRHIQGAINIPAFAIGGKPLPATARVVIYDDGLGSGDGERAAAILLQQGFADVFVLSGGLTEWNAERHPVVSPPGLVQPFIEPIAAVQLEKLIDAGRSLAVLDLRPAAAWREGHLPGARNVADTRELSEGSDELKSADVIVVYDDGSGQAEKQAERLRRLGFRAVRYLYGGMPAWKQAELRMEK